MSHIQSDLKAYYTVTNLGLLQFLTNHHKARNHHYENLRNEDCAQPTSSTNIFG